MVKMWRTATSESDKKMVRPEKSGLSSKPDRPTRLSHVFCPLIFPLLSLVPFMQSCLNPESTDSFQSPVGLQSRLNTNGVGPDRFSRLATSHIGSELHHLEPLETTMNSGVTLVALTLLTTMSFAYLLLFKDRKKL